MTERKSRGLAGRLAAGLLGTLLLTAAAPAPAQSPAQSDGRPGAPPATPWACPASHPIKGYLSEESGLLYHRPGGRFYEEAGPARCYASEEEARRDGARRSPDDELLRR